MKIAFTVCSLNRLGQVLSLSNSILRYNPTYRFVVGLADEIEDRIDVSLFPEITFINLSNLHLANHVMLTSQYDIFELSCALKPYFANYLLCNYQPNVLVYLDTDILVYDSLTEIENQLINHPIILTPHYTAPIKEDNKYPLERDVLNSGLYNGGFFAVNNSTTAKNFIAWWLQRLATQGYNNVSEGMMVDQLWLNLVPLFFDNTLILNHPGCNTAYWNLQERDLKETENGKILCNETPLIFFHFSGYSPYEPEKLSKHQNRFTLLDNPILKKIVSSYFDQLQTNKYQEYLTLACKYGKKKSIKKHSIPKMVIINFLSILGYKLEKIRRI